MAVLWLGLWRTHGMRLYNVQTASMAPVMQPGDLVVTAKADYKKLQAGQIVSYQNSQSPKTVITHRIYKTFPDKSYLVTKGDALAQPDPPIPYSSLTGKTTRVVPGSGYVFSFLHQPIGLALLIYLPALLICAYEIQRIANLYSYRSYSATQYL